MYNDLEIVLVRYTRRNDCSTANAYVQTYKIPVISVLSNLKLVTGKYSSLEMIIIDKRALRHLSKQEII